MKRVLSILNRIEINVKENETIFYVLRMLKVDNGVVEVIEPVSGETNILKKIFGKNILVMSQGFFPFLR